MITLCYQSSVAHARAGDHESDGRYWLGAGRPLRRAGPRRSATAGTVNASWKNYQQAADALAKAGPRWLGPPITRWVPLSSWPQALTKTPDDVKAVADLRA